MFRLMPQHEEILKAVDLTWKEAHKEIITPEQRLKDVMDPERCLFNIGLLIREGYLKKGASLRTSYLSDRGRTIVKELKNKEIKNDDRLHSSYPGTPGSQNQERPKDFY